MVADRAAGRAAGSDKPTDPSRRRFLTAAAVGAGVVVGGVGGASIRSMAGEPAEADVGFCTDMTTHHVQALVLCQRVLGRDTGDPVQAAASEVLQNQAMEVGQMRAWLTDWDESTSPPELVMGWMGAGDGAGVPVSMMPGYATDEDLNELSLLTGRDQGRRWLELMRAHHEGGVAMASRAAELATVDKVSRLATAQVAVQSFEIAQYDQLLAGEYAG